MAAPDPTPTPTAAARVPWAQNLPIALRLGLAMGLLLALLGGVVAMALQQSEWVGGSSRQLAESGLRLVTLARKAQTEALLGAVHLDSLFLLTDKAQRVPVYALIDRAAAARNAAMDELAAAARDPEAAALAARIMAARERFNAAFQQTVEAVELDVASARPQMVEQTLPALHAMLGALDAMAHAETDRAHARLAEIDSLQQVSRQRILGLGALAVLLALVSALLITRSVAEPLRAAARLARQIAAGQMQGVLPPAGRDEVGALVRALGRMRGSLVERESRIAELAFRDGLTGLANRTLFAERLAQAAASAGRLGHPVSVLLLNLDRFRAVNDVLGREVGDQLLVQVGLRLSAELTRSTDTLARLGGDEFAVLLPTQGVDEAQAVARRLLVALDKPLALNGQTLDVNGSIGIASIPQDTTDGDALMAKADLAMYVAKQTRSGHACFAPAMERASEHGLGLLGDLRRAIDENQLRLVFQPKVVLHDGSCHAAEALVRWQHPERGFIAPDQFIPFAEQTGFIRSITAWVIRQAMAQLAEWEARGLSVSLNVNVSTRDLLEQALPTLVREQLEATGIAPQRLCLEVTESGIMAEPARALATLQALHAMGVRLSIDDFGTGYSSLAYLKKLPVDELKIDRSFVTHLDRDAGDATIVRSTIELAHNLGLRVVAEGIETDAVRQRLIALGCDEAQGYWFSRPLSADDFWAWMQRTPPPDAAHPEAERRVHLA